MPNEKQQSPSQSQILVVDDHPIVRRGLVEVINGTSGLHVFAEADDVEQAIELVSKKVPDLVVTDYTMEGRNGLELIKDLKALHPSLPILVLSMHDESLYAERALRAGARGYIMKQRGTDNLITAIKQVLSGQIYLSEKMSRQVLERFSGQGADPSHSPIARLSDREFEVFQLVGEGKNAKEIASHLHISTKTVDAHRANIKEKLELKSGTDLVLRAVRWVESQ